MNLYREEEPPLPVQMEMVADTLEVYLELGQVMSQRDMDALRRKICEWRAELTAPPPRVETPRLRLVFPETAS